MQQIQKLGVSIWTSLDPSGLLLYQWLSFVTRDLSYILFWLCIHIELYYISVYCIISIITLYKLLSSPGRDVLLLLLSICIQYQLALC